MKKQNKIREKLQKGQISIGSWLNLASPLAAEVMASVGFDWLAVDAEHSPIGLERITEIIRATECNGATPIVRAWDDRPETLGRLLDAGVMGIVVPHVKTPEQATRIALACRYPPQGKRSQGAGRGLTFGLDYLEWINEEVRVIAQIEDREGIENAEAIMRVEGIDIGFLGPGDLALDMGVPLGSPEHEQAMQDFLVACQKMNKHCGIPVATGEALQERKKQGFMFFDLSSDMRFLKEEAERQLEAARAQLHSR